MPQKNYKLSRARFWQPPGSRAEFCGGKESSMSDPSRPVAAGSANLAGHVEPKNPAAVKSETAPGTTFLSSLPVNAVPDGSLPFASAVLTSGQLFQVADRQGSGSYAASQAFMHSPGVKQQDGFGSFTFFSAKPAKTEMGTPYAFGDSSQISGGTMTYTLQAAGMFKRADGAFSQVYPAGTVIRVEIQSIEPSHIENNHVYLGRTGNTEVPFYKPQSSAKTEA
jgi:hypothetical protein